MLLKDKKKSNKYDVLQEQNNAFLITKNSCEAADLYGKFENLKKIKEGFIGMVLYSLRPKALD